MQKKFIVSSSPFSRNQAVSTRRLMGDVLIALAPTALAAVWFFGTPAIATMLISVIGAVLSEYLYERVSRQPSTIGDLSAAVTGLILAFNLPANVPWWMPLIGSFLAIVLVKQMFGGIGSNFINPALAARTILMLSWLSLINMGGQVMPQGGQIFKAAVDATSQATPLALKYSLWDLFIGNVPGMLGETCKLTLLLGGAYLVVRKVIDWRTPVTFIVASFVLFWINKGNAADALYEVLAGGLILGAVFMATDYVTSPITRAGHVVMGLGCALILFVIRTCSSTFPEGCSFAIMFMNVMTPLIDKWTTPKTFGYVKPKKA